jgi:serine/threonine protein kinase
MMANKASALDPYQLVDRFAVGGAAEVYRARHKSGTWVVVKRLRPDLPFDPEVSGGFLREIQLAMLSRHDNLVRGLDHGTHDGLDFVVLEYVEGGDLEQLWRRSQKARVDVPVGFWLFILRQVLSGLDFAHQMLDASGDLMGLVHRDINPRNVLIDFEGNVKVADFGAAVATFLEPTPAEVVGSPGYMAPEQASLHSIDRRSDLYAVGCMMYELVVGDRAFDVDGKGDAAILKAHQTGAIKSIPHTVDEQLRLIIEIATSVDPEERYRDAASFKTALDLHAEGSDEHWRSLLGKGMKQLFSEEWRAAQARRGS